MTGAIKASGFQPPALRLNALLAEAGLAPLDITVQARFEDYISLILRWNAQINLTALRDREGILRRHFVESIACARALPEGIATLLDFGSGAGFPGIPIALCRSEVAVTLAESQGKKAAFLQDVVRTLRIPTKVYAFRAESLTVRFDCVTLRAVDRMPHAVAAAAHLIAPGGTLALMTTEKQLAGLQAAAGSTFSWSIQFLLPTGGERLVAFGKKVS